jgi:hypothetical protein
LPSFANVLPSEHWRPTGYKHIRPSSRNCLESTRKRHINDEDREERINNGLVKKYEQPLPGLGRTQRPVSPGRCAGFQWETDCSFHGFYAPSQQQRITICLD